MTALQTIAVAFAMFFGAADAAVCLEREKNMRYALCAFPLIGVVIGALWCLCGALPLPDFARAAGFCLMPVWVTGGIHLDGYADTCDALSSYGDTAKKLEILKGPPLRCVRCYPAVQLFYSLLGSVCLCAVHPARGCVVDISTGGGSGALRAGGGSVPHGKKTPAWPILLPRRRIKPTCAAC